MWTDSRKLFHDGIFMPDEHFEIHCELPDHYFRTEIPNIVFDMGLDPYELSLYCHLKRIIGDNGTCWRSRKSLCETTGIGDTKIRECLKSLSSNRENFEFPLIKITPRKKPDGSPDSCLITICPIWKLNGTYYRNLKNELCPSPNEGGVGRQTRGGGSPNEGKEEPYKNVVVVNARAHEEPTNPEHQSPPIAKPIISTRDKSPHLKSQMFYLCGKLKKDWTTEEMMEAWDDYIKDDTPVSNFVEYIGGIIKNMRIVKDHTNKKQEHQQCKSQKNNQTKSNLKQEEPDLKKKAEQEKSRSLGRAMMERYCQESLSKRKYPPKF